MFSTRDVIERAKDAFWDSGYDGTALSDLERATQLNRSSLYHAFGSKEELFQQALGSYIDSFVWPLIEPMQRPQAGLDQIEEFFNRLAAMFRADTSAARNGCLWVNSIVESAGREPAVKVRAAEYRDLLRSAFGNALSTSSAIGLDAQRANDDRVLVLMGATLGIWVAVRIDPVQAALLCESVIAEMRSWQAPAG
jgi:AcrR family transcriptional regulator